MMWFILACGSALFAGVTAILAKCGMAETDAHVVTALRTVVVLVFAWMIVFISGGVPDFASIEPHTFVFLILSGLSTGASWLCYFKALQIGDINKVIPIDKSSTILTMLLAALFLGENINGIKALAMVSMGIGTYLMIQKKEEQSPYKVKRGWFFYAVASAIFASLTAILGKVGIEGIDANLGTAIRTVVVLMMAWLLVFVAKKQHTIRFIDRKSWCFILLSGVTTGASWLCYYRALQTGPASIIVPIDKLSLVITIAFSYFVFKEQLNKRSLLGLILIVGGTLSLLI